MRHRVITFRVIASRRRGNLIAKLEPAIVGLWMGIIAVVVGVLVIAFPDLIRWILGIALIVMGLMAIAPALKK